jgi:aquaporin related protein
MSVSTSLGPGVSIARGLFIEMFLTAELVFTICMLAAEKHKGTFIAPIGIGLALFIAELSGVYFTGGSLNPARSFGPCVVLRSFPTYHWIYWLGPSLGALIAVGFYRFCKVLEYETANPGQDFNEKEDEAFTFDEENAATSADVERPDPIDITHSRENSGQIPGLGSQDRNSYSPSSPTSNGRGDGMDSNYNRQTYRNSTDVDPNTPVMNRGRPKHTDLDGYNDSYRSGPTAESGSGQPLGERYRVPNL